MIILKENLFVWRSFGNVLRGECGANLIDSCHLSESLQIQNHTKDFLSDIV